MTIIGTKWVFRNKLDENGVVSRNKARLVTQGYNPQEGIDYDETYAPVARLESIRILLAYACALDFKLFQMDVKSAFLDGFINEEETFYGLFVERGLNHFVQMSFDIEPFQQPYSEIFPVGHFIKSSNIFPVGIHLRPTDLKILPEGFPPKIRSRRLLSHITTEAY
ncbi:copia protein [Tanacetum coccineum]